MVKSLDTRNGQTAPAARIGYADLSRSEINILCAAEDDYLIAVADKPSRVIRREYRLTRTPAQVARLIKFKFLKWVRTEKYNGDVTCDIYRLTDRGRKEVMAFYADCEEKARPAEEAYRAKQAATERQMARMAAQAALNEQGVLNIPDCFEEIANSRTPFLLASLPMFAPLNEEGKPITVREYLFHLSYVALPDEAQQTLRKFHIWSKNIGAEDAVLMLSEQAGLSGLLGGGIEH